jgi:hypothetical protein
VTESEWLASDDPGAMLEWLTGPRVVRNLDLTGEVGGEAWRGTLPTNRRLRLFACACCRLAWDRLDSRSREAVARAEAWADGAADDCGRDALARTTATGCLTPDPAGAARQALRYSARCGLPPAAQAALLRDLCGNPWKQYAWTRHHDCSPSGHDLQFLDEAWLTPTVLALARAAYEERRQVACVTCGGRRLVEGEGRGHYGATGTLRRCPDCRGTGHQSDGLLDPDRLAVLADALEDAGCEEGTLLGHLRGREPCSLCVFARGQGDVPVWCGQCLDCSGWIPLRGPHARGCWAIDLVLGKE